MHRLLRPGVSLRIERLEDRNLLNAALATFDDLNLQTAHYDAHRILVAVEPGLSLSAANPAIASASERISDGLFAATLTTGVTVPAALTYFQAQPWVRYATPDYTVSVTRTPNDASFTSQWGLNNTGQSGGTVGADIDAAAAWNVTVGSGRTVVAAIDTCGD